MIPRNNSNAHIVNFVLLLGCNIYNIYLVISPVVCGLYNINAYPVPMFY